MGAWGAGPFENDDACDWAIELADGEDDSPIIEAFDAVLGNDDYLDVDLGSAAVAAAQTLASLAGDGTKLPDDVAEWVRLQTPDIVKTLLAKHRDVAIRALARVRGKDSELAELWQEADATEWLESLDRLERALRVAK